ncbi:hypothetical protein ACQ9BO_08705 [Flavobacterium sp. P21]|uniref:hypothetical protein n=1 Tax=Flavobacterium sp. P21 TaxID=3423948 RepID=UPI003D66C439
MDLKQFKEKLFSLQPSLNDLLDEGYSHDGAMDIIDNEYVLKPKKIKIITIHYYLIF